MKSNCSFTPKRASKSNPCLFLGHNAQSSVSSTKLFSVPAIFSTAAGLLPADEYHFIFSHDGRRQKAVLKKTFLTGLKKDNVRITWEDAVMDLTVGCEVKIDITDLGAPYSYGNLVVFGLYFYTNNAVMNPESKFSLNGESRIEVFDDIHANKREEGGEYGMDRGKALL